MSIEVKNLSYTYMQGSPFARQALFDINMNIEPGKITAIIGHTGSGKSTLIQHLNGLIQAQSGTVTVDGVVVNKKSAVEIRKKIGLIFQYPEYQLFEETVFKDIAYGITLRGVDEAEIKQRVEDTAQTVGLPLSVMDNSPFDLSGGQKRRVAIAGVLVMKPEVLIMDEPAAGLDPEGKVEIFKLIRRLNRDEGITVVIVSHSMEDIAETADTIIVMNKGRVFKTGTPGEVFMDVGALRGMGLDVPQITYLMYKLKEYRPEISDVIYTVKDAYDEIISHCGSVREDKK